MSLFKENNYKIIDTIGESTNGKVVHMKVDDEDKAFKIIEIPGDRQNTRFLKSAGMSQTEITHFYKLITEQVLSHLNMLQELKLSHMVPLEDISVQADDTYKVCITMPLLETFKHYYNVETDRSTKAAVELVIKAAEAVEQFHRAQIVSGYLSLNDFFVKDGQCLISDLGLDAILSQQGTKKVSLYEAPEVYRGEDYDERADVYTMGLILYQLMNNDQMPLLETVSYSAINDSLQKRAAGVSFPYPANADAPLANIIMKAVSPVSFNRYESMREFKVALVDYLMTVNQNTSKSHILMGKAEQSEDGETKIRLLLQAKQVNKNASYLDERLADAYYDQGEYENAIASYKTYIVKEPQSVSPYVKIGRAYDHLSDNKKAIQSYEAALTKMINNGVHHYKDEFMTTALYYAYDIKQTGLDNQALEYVRVHKLVGDELGELPKIIEFAGIKEVASEEIDYEEPFEDEVENIVQTDEKENIEDNEDVLVAPVVDEDDVEEVVDEEKDDVTTDDTEDHKIKRFAFDDEEEKEDDDQNQDDDSNRMDAYAAALAAAAALTQKLNDYDPFAKFDEKFADTSSEDIVNSVINNVKTHNDENVEDVVEEVVKDIEETTDDVIEEVQDDEVAEDVEETTDDVDEDVEDVVEEVKDDEEVVEDAEETTDEVVEEVEDVVEEVQDDEVVEDVEETTDDVDEDVEEVVEEVQDEEDVVEEVQDDEVVEDVEETTDDVVEDVEDVVDEVQDDEEVIEDVEETTDDVVEEVEDVVEEVQDDEEVIEDVEETTDDIDKDVEKVVEEVQDEEDVVEEVEETVEEVEDVVEEDKELTEEDDFKQEINDLESKVSEAVASIQPEVVEETDNVVEDSKEEKTDSFKDMSIDEELAELEALFGGLFTTTTKEEKVVEEIDNEEIVEDVQDTVDEVVEEVEDEKDVLEELQDKEAVTDTVENTVEEVDDTVEEVVEEVQDEKVVEDVEETTDDSVEETVEEKAPELTFEQLMDAANNFAQEGDYEAQANVLRKALHVKTGDIEAMLQLAEADRMLGQYQEAQYNLKRIMTIDPNEARAYIKMGAVSARQNAIPAAIDYYEQGLKLMIFDQNYPYPDEYEAACNNYAYLVSHSRAKRISPEFNNALERAGFKREARRLRQLVRRSGKIK